MCVLQLVTQAQCGLWALDHLPDPTDKKTRWILDYLPETYSAKRLPRWPAALHPPPIDRRTAVQLSASTIHGPHPDGLPEYADRKASWAGSATMKSAQDGEWNY